MWLHARALLLEKLLVGTIAVPDVESRRYSARLLASICALRRATFSSIVSPGGGKRCGGTGISPQTDAAFRRGAGATGGADGAVTLGFAFACNLSSAGAPGVNSVEASGARSAAVSAPAAGEAVAAAGLKGAAEA